MAYKSRKEEGRRIPEPTISWYINCMNKIVQQRAILEMGFAFSLKRKGTDGRPDYYECLSCKNFVSLCKRYYREPPSVRTIKISGDNFLRNPDELEHVCIENDVETRWAKIIVTHHYK
jgi:hypothetical protein